MKIQSAIEFLSTYSWAFLILGIFVVSILAVVISPTRQTETHLPESCYISTSLPCYQALVLANSTTTRFLVVFQNSLGVGMSMMGNR